MRISVTAEVVGSGSDGTEPSLLLNVERHGVYSDDVKVLKRYLFNCGEGTQRLAGENGIKLSSLDAMYFTRFDIKSVSGVPGVIFALGSSGSATLRLHGPVGLRGFLGAIRSFVRRKYPQIQCVEITDSTTTTSSQCARDSSVAASEYASFSYEQWGSNGAQTDQHATIIPVELRRDGSNAVGGNAKRALCLLCSKEAPLGESSRNNVGVAFSRDTAATSTSKKIDGTSLIGRRRDNESDEHEVWRAWLTRYYIAKVPEKVPYVDVVLNRYRGHYDDLKRQLCSKYGDFSDDPKAAATESPAKALSSSSESGASSDEDSDSGGTTVNFVEQPLDRQWLEKFYAHHQPDKLAHVDKVLKQFGGREDTLKQMLLRKYGRTVVNSSHGSDGRSKEVSGGSGAPKKKRKLLDDSEKVVKEIPEDQPAKVYVDAASVTGRSEPDVQPHAPGSLCYVLQFHYAPYPTVWIIDCRSEDYIDSLTKQFGVATKDQSDGCCTAHSPSLIVHFSPSHVRMEPRYARWMARLVTSKTSESHPEHLIFDGEALQSVVKGAFSFSFLSSAKSAIRRDETLRASSGIEDLPSTLSPGLKELASFLKDSSGCTTSQVQRQIVQRVQGTEHEAHFAQSKLQIRLMHPKETQLGLIYDRTGWRQKQRALEEEGADSEEDMERQDRQAFNIADTMIPNPSVRKLIILGTGSAAPSKLRASSGMYLELSEPSAASVESMLVDCGEGTYGQLWRQFGRDVAQRIAGLRCVWISHNHADHHCGLVRVLYEYWRFHAHHQGNKNPPALVVIAPQSVLSYVESWLPQFMGESSQQLIQLTTCSDFNDASHPLRRQLLTDIGYAVISITSVRVFHCYDSYGLVLTLRSGKKLVYSGDTKPCNQLVISGMDAALLVHEATFDDSMQQDATVKKHSTVGQALDIARRMRAQQVVLTHFSQRYPSLPPTTVDGPPSEGITSTRRAPGPTTRVWRAFDGFVHAIPE